MGNWYFDSSSDYKPLLHTWSLGVEAQFYLILPLLPVVLLPGVSRSVLLPALFFSPLAASAREILFTYNQHFLSLPSST